MKRVRSITILLALIFLLSLAVPALAASQVTWKDYQQWLVDNIAAISPFPEPVSAIVWETESWEEIEEGYNSGPWGKFFDEDCYNASTWEEFVAAGGVGTFNEDFVDLPMGPDADTSSSGEASEEPTEDASGEPSNEASVEASGEPSAEASGEPSGEASEEASREPSEEPVVLAGNDR